MSSYDEQRRQRRQRLFDTSYHHIMKQGMPSMVGASCLYSGPHGTSCAAAPFIIDYDPSMENLTWGVLVAQFPPGTVTDESLTEEDLVADLQDCHDQSASPERDDDTFIRLFKDKMKALAERQGLTVPDVA